MKLAVRPEYGVVLLVVALWETCRGAGSSKAHPLYPLARTPKAFRLYRRQIPN